MGTDQTPGVDTATKSQHPLPESSQSAVDDLYAAATSLAATLDSSDVSTAHSIVVHRLQHSVLRPLDTVASPGGPGDVVADGHPLPDLGQLDGLLWGLATRATQLVSTPGTPSAVGEAAAALADLACRGPQVAEGTDTSDRRAELARLLAGIDARIAVSTDGPYLLTNVPAVVDWLGETLELAPQAALCRCGASQLKPLCDGSHASIGFTGAKDPDRVPDQRDTYPGVSLTVLDNRGTCAHSGFCTDRLNQVFHAEGDPFVTPSGGRMDEIVRAVRECPSGALSFAVDGREAREQVDRADRTPRVEVSKDGPYRVTGRIQLLDDGGADVVRNAGASMEHYSLCRCGQSRNKPFCSGRHWEVHFTDPKPDPGHQPTLFEWAGGTSAFIRLTRRFYETHVPTDPLLAPLFAKMTPDHPERVAAWLAEVFGGPTTYSDHYGGYHHMVSEHMGANLTEAQRARFAELMVRSADDVGLSANAEFRAAFVAYLEWGTRLALENSQPGAHPPQQMPMPRWWWVCDATPGARVSALAPPEEAVQVTMPGPGEQVSFAAHIRPLFRQSDRSSMAFAFDLWDPAAVRTHAQAILGRIESGSMPCDGAWPPERVEVLKRWIGSGMAD